MSDTLSLYRLISKGEGQSLEFKAAVPDVQHLAREIAAFANSGGGKILLGVRDDGSISGVDGDIGIALDAALSWLTPRPEVLLTYLPDTRRHSVACIDVENEPDGPVTLPDGIFMRSGTQIRALSADAMQERANVPPDMPLAPAFHRVATAVESLTSKVLSLEAQLKASRSWRKRSVDIVIGAILSAVLGLILALRFLRPK